MVFWMRRHGRTLKRELENGLSRSVEHRPAGGASSPSRLPPSPARAARRSSSSTASSRPARPGHIAQTALAIAARARRRLRDLLAAPGFRPAHVLAHLLPRHRRSCCSASARRFSSPASAISSPSASCPTRIRCGTPRYPASDTSSVGGLVASLDRLPVRARYRDDRDVARLLGRHLSPPSVSKLALPTRGAPGPHDGRDARGPGTGAAGGRTWLRARRSSGCATISAPSRRLQWTIVARLCRPPDRADASAAARPHRAYLERPDGFRAVRLLGHLVAGRAAFA